MERGYGQVSCNNACKDYKYFALQDNDWCVCGDAYATETKYVKNLMPSAVQMEEEQNGEIQFTILVKRVITDNIS